MFVFCLSILGFHPLKDFTRSCKNMSTMKPVNIKENSQHWRSLWIRILLSDFRNVAFGDVDKEKVDFFSGGTFC